MLETNPVDAAPAVSDMIPVAIESSAAPQEGADIGVMYAEYRDLLLHVACRKFRVPEIDAENLIQEVFLGYLENQERVENARPWLVAAVCNASRAYWRSTGRTDPLPDDILEQSDPVSHGLADRFAVMLTLRQALRYLQPRCRETLYMHYYEGRSAVDIARDMDTTTRYSEKLIHNCLKRVREIYFSITTVRRR
ncbi:MAG TPA: sigma-70 family RNA polymerase sigma factor [Thermoanaerobaculia bacterium]|jgi:RNA polymerase sigma factor (sigma-70 family)|nr:sigma-70 family RNA polymerase sigma factor [Thermoanaerobaculia bacterium]